MNKKLHKTIINRNTGLIVVVAENKMAVFNFSGSLKNNFDKDKVQNEIDLQVKVTKEFRSNVQHFQAEQNKRKDELKAKLERNEISQKDYDEQVSRIQKQSLLVNMIAGGLTAPSDSVLGVATSTVAPLASHEIGQYFKDLATQNENGQLSTSQELAHILTHAALGAATAAANGTNAVTGAISAGGAEAAAPILSRVLYGENNPANLNAEQKETLTNIVALSVLPVGSNDFSDMFIAQTVALNAVNNNAVEMGFNKKKEKLYVLDMDTYNPNKPLIYVTNPKDYVRGKENQVLVFDGVFTGEDRRDGQGNTGVFNRGELLNGEYYLVEQEQRPGWFRIDKKDNKPFNDIDDDSERGGWTYTKRNALRLHLGRNSLGCVTVTPSQTNRDMYEHLKDMMNHTSTTTVQDKSGNSIDRFLGKDRQNGADVKVYGTMRIR